MSEWEEVKARAGERSETAMCPEQGERIHLKLETSTSISLFTGGMLKNEHNLML